MTSNQVVRGSALSLLLVLGLVAIGPAGASTTDDDATALALLRRAMSAANSLSYDGVMVVATWTPSGSTTRMIDVHQAAGTRSVTVRATGGGQAVTTSWPVADRELLTVDVLPLLAGAYTVGLGGSEEVAGRPGTVVVARRNGRVAAQLWVDDATGLVLRQEVLDARGRLTRLASFVEVRTVPAARVPAQRGAGSQPTPTVTVVRTGDAVGSTGGGGAVSAGGSPGEVDAAGTAGEMFGSMVGGSPSTGRPEAMAAGTSGPLGRARKLGSSLPEGLPGGFRLVQARAVPVGSRGGTAVQLTYCDGISGLSVFEQRGRLPVTGVPGLAEQVWAGTPVFVGSGWPAQVVWQGDGSVLTVVTDAPLDEVRDVVAALPHTPHGSTGLFGRLTAMTRAVLDLLPGR